MKTGGEARYLALAQRLHPEVSDRLFLLRRSLRVRRRGAWRDVTAPIFSGYVFFRADNDLGALEALRGLSGFIRFLPANSHVQPLGARDAALLGHFLSFGEVAGRSVVTFDEKSRIRVASGPLLGLDGRIVKVDRRKRRARVRLSLYEESFEIDFGFEALAPQAKGSATETNPAPAGRDGSAAQITPAGPLGPAR